MYKKVLKCFSFWTICVSENQVGQCDEAFPSSNNLIGEKKEKEEEGRNTLKGKKRKGEQRENEEKSG